jgi:DNA-binding phage protein
MRKMRTYREYLIDIFTDRDEAIGHLQVALEDYQTHGNTDIFLFLLETVVEAQGGISELAKQTDTKPHVLSDALTRDDLPLIDRLGTVLKALGYQLSIKPLEVGSHNLETSTTARQAAATPLSENQDTPQPAAK